MDNCVWLLVGSVLLNIFFVYAWFHDVALYKSSYDRLERRYHEFVDYHRGDPPGTTSRRLVEGWPAGSEIREEAQRKHDRQYKEEPSSG